MTTNERVEFLLGDALRSLAGVTADLMLLPYLREVEFRTGTKEGCGSGDCGACTVVVAKPERGRLAYRAVNSCITSLTAIHGHQLITVEDLGSPEDLHQVQQAMVDGDGSQCGFCTPGFVMSLFALTKQPGVGAETDVIESLSGNLCRCTGYRPIIDVARDLVAAGPDEPTDGHSAIVSQLESIDDGPTVVRTNKSTYLAPTALADALNLLHRHPGCRILAGGTDLALEVTQSLARLDTVLFVGQIRELLEIVSGEDEVTFGAAVTYNNAASDLLALYPECDELLRRLGSTAIRNQGTIGGNIANASPIADMPPFLLAVDADISLASAEGTRRVPIASFFVDYRRTILAENELISAIHVPRPQPDWHFRVYKVSKRFDDDISAVCVAVNALITDGTVHDVRIGCGGLAGIPRRASATQAALRGRPWSLDSFTDLRVHVERDFSPIDDLRAGAEYRSALTLGLLERFFRDVNDPGTPVEVSRYAASPADAS